MTPENIYSKIHFFLEQKQMGLPSQNEQQKWDVLQHMSDADLLYPYSQRNKISLIKHTYHLTYATITPLTPPREEGQQCPSIIK